jgi:hypothetical protein
MPEIYIKIKTSFFENDIEWFIIIIRVGLPEVLLFSWNPPVLPF